MHTYEVLVTRNFRQEEYLTIDADSNEEAENIADAITYTKKVWDLDLIQEETTITFLNMELVH